MPPIPEITVETLAQRLRSADDFVILDVREPWETQAAQIGDPRVIVVPMGQLARLGPGALPPAAQVREAELLVLCHHGNRSGQVTAWLSSRGWTRVFSVAGGIDEYARRVDSSVGSY